jgi:hypothetical protein
LDLAGEAYLSDQKERNYQSSSRDIFSDLFAGDDYWKRHDEKT